MSPDDLTLIEAIDLLAKRGFRVIADPAPELPFCNYFIVNSKGQVAKRGVTGASLRMLAAYGCV